MTNPTSQEKQINGLQPVAAAVSQKPYHKIALYIGRVYENDSAEMALREAELYARVARLNRFEEFGSITHVFHESTPTESLDRPGLQALIEAVKSGEVTVVVVPSFLDLRAYLPEFIKLLKVFDEYGCGLYSLHEYLIHARYC